MDAYLDENVGDQVRLLPDLLRGLTRERDRLQDQVICFMALVALPHV